MPSEATPAAGVTIGAWFVSDDPNDATFFPQIGLRSDDPKGKEIYWRCICDFYASSKAINTTARHVLFTNTNLPTVDGLSVGEFLSGIGIDVINIPITYRIKSPEIKSWGNQFYILDVIKYLSKESVDQLYLILDTDCVWIKPVDDMASAIAEHGVLTYELGHEAYLADQPINGCTRAGMADFLRREWPTDVASIPYFGGEIFAATSAETRRIADQIDAFWAHVADPSCEIKEEAHFLSVIYARNGYKAGTANRFIKRMWTTFSHRNTTASDFDLTVWHLPAEKKTGFLELFKRLAAAFKAGRPFGDILSTQTYAQVMGVPNRSPSKFASDLAEKLREKLKL